MTNSSTLQDHVNPNPETTNKIGIGLTGCLI